MKYRKLYGLVLAASYHKRWSSTFTDAKRYIDSVYLRSASLELTHERRGTQTNGSTELLVGKNPNEVYHKEEIASAQVRIGAGDPRSSKTPKTAQKATNSNISKKAKKAKKEKNLESASSSKEIERKHAVILESPKSSVVTGTSPSKTLSSVLSKRPTNVQSQYLSSTSALV
eukprot:2506257-Ditylum_brightwellii.AAC.1